MQGQWISTTVQLPGGKIWMGTEFADEKAGPVDHLLANWKMNLIVSGGVDGSNWLTVGQMYRDWAGIKADGTLWVSPAPKQPLRRGVFDWRAYYREHKHLVQFGTETNWSRILPFGFYSFLVKSDGTLWRWGSMTNIDRQHPWPGLQTFTPERQGVETNWADIFSFEGNPYFLKTDGSLWFCSGPKNTNGVKIIQIDPDLTVYSVGNIGSNKLRSATRIYYGKEFKAGVLEDGSFRVWAEEDRSQVLHYDDAVAWKKADLRLDGVTNWLAVAGRDKKIVTLRNDGTLWLWDFGFDYRLNLDYGSPDREIVKVKPVRLGTHSDWIAISGNYDHVTALAADGSLWYWPVSSIGEEDGSYDSSNQNGIYPLIHSSRKPQLLGNVFASTP